MREKYFIYERKLSLFLRKHSILILRCALGIIYFWYGFLKLLQISPAEELVLRSTVWLHIDNFVIILGGWEVLIGICLFVPRLLRLGLWLLFLQFPGTFLPIFFSPEEIFTIFPYGLTVEGQYVFKNIILVAAGLALIGSLHAKRPDSDHFPS